jgi:hypothetical protein
VGTVLTKLFRQADEVDHLAHDVTNIGALTRRESAGGGHGGGRDGSSRYARGPRGGRDQQAIIDT